MKRRVASFKDYMRFKDPKYKRLFERKFRIDRTYDIPYLAGYSKDGYIIYIDRHLPEKLPNGVSVIPFISTHERVEKAMLDAFKISYQEAHHYALMKEAEEVKKANLSWDSYSKYLDKYIKLSGSEKLMRVPKDLDLKPYKDERDNRLLHTIRSLIG